MRTKVHTHTREFHPDAQDEFNRLALEEKRLTRAMARTPEDETPVVVRMDGQRRRLSDPPANLEQELADVRAAMDAQRAIIDSGKVRITFRGLTRGEFRRLLTAHPPREGDELDKQVGYNGDTFLDAYVESHIVKAETLSGEPVTVQWSEWADEMTNGQWEEIRRLCLGLTNDGEPVFPR
ncbi:hypothetical protein EOL73_04730 [Candidatus Saccharibacteria bacterium]|nr:hypothetical protein [Candidatus Saccharibacteria bacterium]